MSEIVTYETVASGQTCGTSLLDAVAHVVSHLPNDRQLIGARLRIGSLSEPVTLWLIASMDPWQLVQVDDLDALTAGAYALDAMAGARA